MIRYPIIRGSFFVIPDLFLKRLYGLNSFAGQRVLDESWNRAFNVDVGNVDEICAVGIDLFQDKARKMQLS